jgi:two-component system, chemotaxis family, chemotaxis protein CheY
MARSALVVDDSESMRRLVCQTLQGIGFSTVEAANGLEALVRTRDIKWLDLVIADLNMPVMDGIKLVSQLRKTPGLSAVPFLLLTTEIRPEHKLKAKAAGASGWMVKPFEPDQLVAVVEKIVR